MLSYMTLYEAISHRVEAIADFELLMIIHVHVNLYLN